jgi:hypothetical protein
MKKWNQPMHKTKAIVFFLLTLADASYACELEGISASFESQKAWNFEQEKIIEVLSRPLLSRGQLWLQRNDILVLQIQYPVTSTTVISADGLRQYNADDELLMDNTNPMFSELSKVLLLLFNRQFPSLQESFDIELVCEEQDAWEAQLEPKDAQLASFLNFVTISGSDEIENISFKEQRGDITRISLSSTSRIPELGIDIN